MKTIVASQIAKPARRSQLKWLIFITALVALCRGAACATFDNSAIPSWGDVVWVYGPGTDPSMDTPQALENMIKHWKGREFTGVYLRTDLAQLDPSMIRRNPPVKRDPRLAVIWNYIDEVSDSYDLFSSGAKAAGAAGFEFWAWHPHIYSDGAPENVGGPGPGRIWPWTYCARYTYDHPEVVTVDRKGNPYWMVREYGYPGARASKVAEFVHMAKKFQVKYFISCMRSESSQIQSPPDKADRFGFNQLVVDDMKRLYDVDIMTDARFDVDRTDFNPRDPMVQNWHDLRGSYVTQFYRDLRKGLNEVDPKIRIAATLSGDYAGPPLGNWRLDWRKWIDEGLIDEIITPVFFEATLDHDAPKKGYLTDVRASVGTVSFRTVRDYINKSHHPEVKITAGGGMPYQFSSPPEGTDGWRTDVWYSMYHLAWYQRWEQWKKDLKELGYIRFLDQNFDGFPLGNNGHAGGWGDARYVPKLRACPGCWTTLGDGTDSKPIAQAKVKRGEKGSAMKLTCSADGRSNLIGWHNSFPDRSNLTDGLDNAMTCGRATFDCWIYRDSEESSLSFYLQGDGADFDVGLKVEPGTGKVSYSTGTTGNDGKAETWTALHTGKEDPAAKRPSAKWIATSYSIPVASWQKLTIKLDLDKKLYSSFAGVPAETELCRDVKYSAPKDRYVEEHGVEKPIKVPAYRVFKQALFVPEGSPGNTTYLDDVSIRWVPTLYFAAVAPKLWLADDFEDHPVSEGIAEGTKAGSGQWRVLPDNVEGYFVDNNTSFGDGVKSLHARGGVELIGVGKDKLTLSSARNITVDLDVFVRSESSFPYMIPNPLTKSKHRTAVSLQEDSGAQVASIQAGDGVWQIWNGDHYTDSGVRIAYDVWNHLQIALDPGSASYKVVVQPVGELPTPVGKGFVGAKVNKFSALRFSLNPAKTENHLTLYDNVQVAYE